MEIEDKIGQALHQAYAALSDDPINHSIKHMIGQLNLMELEQIDKKVSEHLVVNKKTF